jgi:glycosyltransferase involved in cell wall biosynthesis
MQLTLYLKHFPARGTPLVGGTSVAVDGLAAGLAANGARVTVLCEGPARSSVTAAAGYAIECFGNRGPQRSFALARELRRYVAEEVAPARGLCLVNGMFHPAACAMGALLRRQAVAYIAVPHGAYDPPMFRSNPHLKWPYWYLLERPMLSRATAVQVLDMRHAVRLRELGIQTPVIEAPNGVSAGGSPPEATLEWRNEELPAEFLFFGRLDAYVKGLDVLLEALARIAAQRDVRLTVQGPDCGDLAALERRAATLSVADRVAFRAPDYRHPPAQTVSEYDVLCLPSRVEGFGLAALDGMLAARVLLVSERAGVARHVRACDCGVTVPPTVGGIADGMRTLLTRRAEWREMGLRGRRYALTTLHWTTIAANALAQYRRVLAHA